MTTAALETLSGFNRGIDRQAAHRIAGLLDAVARWTGGTLDLVERVERVDLAPDRLTLSLNLFPLGDQHDTIVRHTVPAGIRRRGVETKLVLEGSGGVASNPDPALIKAAVRAHRWFDDLLSGRAQSLGDIAEKEGVSDRYVRHLIPLAFLAPDIVEAILTGTQPVHLTAEILTNRIDLPLTWSEQKALLSIE